MTNVLLLFSRLEKAGVKLQLVDKQLKIKVPKGDLDPELLAELKEKKAAIIQFMQQLQGGKTRTQGIEAVEKKEYYRLSSAQTRLYILQAMEESSTRYNISGVYVLEGGLDRERLKESFQDLIARHESLRTFFTLVDGEPVQRVLDQVAFGLEVFRADGRSGQGGQSGQELIEIIVQDFIRPFDLARAPLLRVGLIGLAEEKHLLMVDMHHIISDGVSEGITVKELTTLYAGIPLPPVSIQYKDYSEWQNSQEQKEALKKQAVYWLEQFKEQIPVLRLPTDYPRPVIQDYAGSYLGFTIDREVTARLKVLAIQANASLYMVLLAAYYVFLARLSGQADIVVGTPVAGRRHADLGGIIGMFVNTLPLRNFFQGSKPFRLWLEEVRENTLAAFQDQDYPLDDLVDRLHIKRDTGRSPIFDVMFGLQNMEQSRVGLSGLRLAPYPYAHRTAKFDLTLMGVEDGDNLAFSLEYSTSLFKEETIRRFTGYYRHILQAVAADPYREIQDLEMMDEAEREQVLLAFNDTAVDYPREKLIQEIFAEQVVKSPDRISIVGANGNSPLHCSFSYSGLDRLASGLAGELIEKGVLPDTIVGLQVGRSIDMIVGILAILKAGAAYLPLDPDLPEARRQYMLADSGAEIVIGPQTVGANCCSPIQDIGAECKGERQFAPTDLAYVMYTSGSTGQPKGVMVCHRNVIRLVINPNFVALSAATRLLLTGAPGFDATTFEIWGPLLNGGLLCLVSKETILDAQRLGSTLKDMQINTLWLSAPLFNQLLEQDSRIFNPLTRLLVGGDVLSPVHINRVRRENKGLTVVNGYGPTENTTFSTCLKIGRDYEERIPIGRPVSNSAVYILDARGRVQPVGVKGEIWVGGDGLARGYLNNPELTAERFVTLNLTPNPSPSVERGDWWSGAGASRCERGAAAIPGTGMLNRIAESPQFVKPQAKLSTVLAGSEGDWCVSPAPYQSPPTTHPSPLTPHLYKTGDRGRWLDDGTIEFLGRVDDQVKIRGFRIEPGEIEAQLLRHPEVKEAVVLAQEDQSGEKALCAYLVTKAGRHLESQVLREFLSRSLPDTMIPSHWLMMEKLPLNANGKVDRTSLPDPQIITAKEPGKYVLPRSAREKAIFEAWKEVLHRDQIGIDDNFFDLGGNSLSIIKLNHRLNQALDMKMPVMTLFRFPTIRSLAAHLGAGLTGEKPLAAGEESFGAGRRPAGGGKDIAVIGMAGRFPGAGDISRFWENLAQGKESISFFTAEELSESGVEPQFLKDPHYVRANGRLADIEFFDNGFFGYSLREAEIIDPQARFLHECAWTALEDAAYDPFTYPGPIGFYAGATYNFEWEARLHLAGKTEVLGSFASWQLMNKDFLSTRIAYKFNLKGPALFVQTACSTSLVAIHLACRGIIDGECDLALAGGTSVTLFEKAGYLYQQGMISSPDGHCRAFDAKAGGTVVGNGTAVVVLKLLDGALADGDHIYAVVKGAAINNDGWRKVGFTAPSIEGQAEVIRAALAAAGLGPETIGYVEAHGTGTELGDPVEIEALKLAFGFDPEKKNFCALGSVKTNIGHLDAAAGAAGFIKAALCLFHRQIPPSLHFHTPNPKIDFENSPFYVNTTLKEWQTGGFPRRASVSSFGMGGTNAHIILEESPHHNKGEEPLTPKGDAFVRPPLVGEAFLLPLSARSAGSLEQMRENLAGFLAAFPQSPAAPTNPSLADVAYTLQVGRAAFAHRYLAVCNGDSPAEAADRLRRPQDNSELSTSQALADGRQEPQVIFMFSGQGSQYVDMALGLYETESPFRQELDRCFKILHGLSGKDFRSLLYPDDPAAGGSIEQTDLAQPLLFSVEYALARLLMHWGIRPQAMIGHSIGEYVAACLAGVFTLEEALRVVLERGRLMQQMPGGAMLGVPLPEEQVMPFIKDLESEVSLAAVNSSSLCTVSGQEAAISGLLKKFLDQGIEARKLHTSHAFHSPMMAPVLADFAATVSAVKPKAPTLAYISNLSGRWIDADEVRQANYWSTHLRNPVRFADGLAELFKLDNPLFVELGPGSALCTFVRKHREKKGNPLIVNLIRHPQEEAPDSRFLLAQVGRLWLHRAAVDWPAFHSTRERRRLSLPSYPFEKRAFPLKFPSGAISGITLPGTPARGKKPDLADWFYTPQWVRSSLSRPPVKEPLLSPWLIFADDLGFYRELTDCLPAEERLRPAPVIVVEKGGAFTKVSENLYRLAPGQKEDYEALFSDLQRSGRLPARIVHLWNVTGPVSRPEDGCDIGAALETGFYSLIFIAQALGRLAPSLPVHIDVVTDRMQEVTGGDGLFPGKALVLGPVQVTGLEYPHITCKSIDLQALDPQKLLLEMTAADRQPVVAWRGPYRWVRSLVPTRLEKPDPASLPLKENGVYLVTGGLGGIGLTLASRLVDRVKARLVLIGRSPFPPAEQWAEWLQAHGEDDPISRKIGQLRGLIARGGSVQVFSADVADRSQMEAVIRQTRERFGAIDGIIHAAGLPDGGMIQQRTRENSDPVLAPKVAGTLFIDRLLAGQKVDFFLLCSSLSSMLAPFGQVAYVSANAFLDAFAQGRAAQTGMPCISVNWGSWQEVGMAVEAVKDLQKVGPLSLQDEILPAEGAEAFERILSSGLSQVAVAVRDVALPLPAARDTEGVTGGPTAAGPAPFTGLIPVDELEQLLARMLADFLGLDRVGLDDNFFELGISSLDLVQISRKLKELVQKEVPVVTMFSFPTIRTLSQHLKGNAQAVPEPTDHQQAGELLEKSIELFKEI